LGTKIHFLSSQRPEALAAVQQLVARYGDAPLAEADYVVAIGGDGTALKALHAVLARPAKPVFAMRLPNSAGALTNALDLAKLPERLLNARRISVPPLKAEAQTDNGSSTIFGINEIALTRQRLQTARLRLRFEESQKFHQFRGDGVVVATPVGSTGYNRSAGGPTLPLQSHLLALTGVAACRPLHWSNRVIDDHSVIDIEVLDPQYRPVRLETDRDELPHVLRTRISCIPDLTLTLLLEDR
jgi:NAD+ kinase